MYKPIYYLILSHFKMRKIMLAFVRCDSDILENSWLNRAAAYVAKKNENGDPPYIHAELLFVPDDVRENGTGDVTSEACSIVYGSGVHLERKRFSRKQWVFRSLACSEDAYFKMYDFCRGKRGAKFNYWGYFTAWFLPFAIDTKFYQKFGMEPRYFCSQIVTSALKEGDLLDESVSESIHPNDLFNLVKDYTIADCGRNINEVSLQL